MLIINTKKRVLQAILSRDRTSSLQPIFDQYFETKRNTERRTWGQACDKITVLESYLLEPVNLEQLEAVGIPYETLSRECVAFRKDNGIPRSEFFSPKFSTPLSELSLMERGRLLGYSSRKVMPPPTRQRETLPAYQEGESDDVVPGYDKNE